MVDEPSVISGVIDGALVLLEKRYDLPRHRLLEVGGLRAEDLSNYDDPVPLHSFALILEEAARLTNDDTLALRLASDFDHVAAGLINNYAWRHAPTVRHSLHTVTKYSGQIFCMRMADLVEGEDSARIRWAYWKSFGGMQQFPNWIPTRLVVMMRRALGAQWKPIRVKLEHAEPENIAPYTEIFGSNLKFNQPENSITFTSEDLAQALPQSDERLWRYLVELAEEVHSQQDVGAGLSDIIKKQIIDALPTDCVNIDLIARSLAKSPRTLQRELDAAGTSFTQILDETKRELAVKYLLDTNLPVSQIASLLGFSEASVFTRAAQRWFGESPKAYRQRNRPSKTQGPEKVV